MFNWTLVVEQLLQERDEFSPLFSCLDLSAESAKQIDPRSHYFVVLGQRQQLLDYCNSFLYDFEGASVVEETFLDGTDKAKCAFSLHLFIPGAHVLSDDREQFIVCFVELHVLVQIVDDLQGVSQPKRTYTDLLAVVALL